MAKANAIPETGEMAGTVVPARDGAINRLKSQLELSASLEGSGANSADITASVIERMMSADSLDEAMDAQDASLPSGKSLADVEMLVNGITVLRSDAKYTEHSLGFYLVVDAVRLDTGEEFRFATGAPNVVALLFRADNQGMLPREFVIRSRETQNGELLSLRNVPKRAVRND
jgi:hypothetical protein